LALNEKVANARPIADVAQFSTQEVELTPLAVTLSWAKSIDTGRGSSRLSKIEALITTSFFEREQ